MGSPAAGLTPENITRAPAATVRAKPSRPTALADMPAGLGFDAGDTSAERIVFQRAPIRIVLPLNKERMVTFPATVALHAPEGFEGLVQSQIIERTAYLTALVPFTTLRVVAEDLTTGRQIPIDLVAVEGGKASLPQVEVHLPRRATNTAAAAEDTAAAAPSAAPVEPPALDMVALTRYAAQSLYAPRRLVPAVAGVRQVPMATTPVQGLYRGWNVQTTPIGAWRSGQLYVTAVRFTNQSDRPMDIDLQELRGQWVAASAQHLRLLGRGSDWDTTAVYLVCDRPFDACR